MADLEISNVVDISVAETPAGLGAFNTSNLALFSYDTPDPVFTDGYKIYLEPSEVGEDFGTGSNTYKMALAVFSQAPNIRAGSGYLVVITMLASETIDDAITRSLALVPWFGGISSHLESQVDMLAGAAVVQAQHRIFFWPQRAAGSIDPGGSLDLLRTGTLTKSRGLYYGGATDLSALLMAAAYAGRGLSVNFSGSNTTITMNLKDLATVQPDPSMSQTIYNKAKIAGADIYASVQGVPKVFSFGANKFYDQVYNLEWFVTALQIAGFNYLAQTATKVPQTEGGMDGLKGAYLEVCKQAIVNQYGAPGRWTSPTTFGNQADMLQNIEQFGYYIFSLPVAQQSAVDRAARKAPLVQIALKEAGAIQTSTVIVNVNA